MKQNLSNYLPTSRTTVPIMHIYEKNAILNLNHIKGGNKNELLKLVSADPLNHEIVNI